MWCRKAQNKLSFYFYPWLGDMILLPASQNAALLSEVYNSQQFLYCFFERKERRKYPSRFSALVQTGPGSHPASYTKGTEYFPGVKRPGRGVAHPPPYSAKVKDSRAIPLLSLWDFVACSRARFTVAFALLSASRSYNYRKYSKPTYHFGVRRLNWKDVILCRFEFSGKLRPVGW